MSSVPEWAIKAAVKLHMGGYTYMPRDDISEKDLDEMAKRIAEQHRLAVTPTDYSHKYEADGAEKDARIVELQNMVDGLNKFAHDEQSNSRHYKARNAELEKALEPFAEHYRKAFEGKFTDIPMITTMMLKHFRRAAEVRGKHGN